MDNPQGTGDHENYLKNTEAYDIDGSKYGKCRKKAVNIRSRNMHEPWYSLSGIYDDVTLLFSRNSRYYSASVLESSPDDISYTRTLSPKYG